MAEEGKGQGASLLMKNLMYKMTQEGMMWWNPLHWQFRSALMRE